jgi:nuclear pore complex protein Nup62
VEGDLYEQLLEDVELLEVGAVCIVYIHKFTYVFIRMYSYMYTHMLDLQHNAVFMFVFCVHMSIILSSSHGWKLRGVRVMHLCVYVCVYVCAYMCVYVCMCVSVCVRVRARSLLRL